ALGKAEILLEIDQQEVDAQPVLGRGPDAVLLAPPDRALEDGLLVRPVAPARRVLGVVEIRDGEFACDRVLTRHFRSALDSGVRRGGNIAWSSGHATGLRPAACPRPATPAPGTRTARGRGPGAAPVARPATPRRRRPGPGGSLPARTGASAAGSPRSAPLPLPSRLDPPSTGTTGREFPDTRSDVSRIERPPGGPHASCRANLLLGKEEQMQDASGPGGHPRGTLAIVALYGLLFALGWLALYFGVYLPRGGVQPEDAPMKVDLYEKIWIGIAIGLIAVFIGSIFYGAAVYAGHPPSHVETIDPKTARTDERFAQPGVTVR